MMGLTVVKPAWTVIAFSVPQLPEVEVLSNEVFRTYCVIATLLSAG